MLKQKILEANLRFGFLTTTGERERIFVGGKGKNKYLWKEKCICDCGNIVYIEGSKLRSGHTKSCGCYHKRADGDINTRFYNIRYGIIRRCRDKSNIEWKRYGGRGITICNEWKDYKNFKKDMFDKYNNFVKIHGEKNTTIDRIDNNKGYNKENCRWATYKEQANNSSNNRAVEYNGKQYKSISAMCDDLGLSDMYHPIANRISRGRSIERAISEDKHLSKRDS